MSSVGKFLDIFWYQETSTLINYGLQITSIINQQLHLHNFQVKHFKNT